MNDPVILLTAMLHTIGGRARDLAGRLDSGERADSGAVSIEQVLWYAAAAVSVAVVAAIIWSQIRSEASNVTVNTPSAP